MCQSTTSSEREGGGDLNDTRLDPYQTVCVCGRRDRLGHHPKQDMWLWWCVLLTLLSLTHATHLTNFLTNKTTLKPNETKRFDITLNSTYPLEQYVVTSEKQFILLLEIRSSQIQLSPTLSSSQPALGQQLTVTLTFGDQHDAQLTWDNKTEDLTPFLDPGKESELELTLINGTVAVNITHTVFQLTPSCTLSDHLLLVVVVVVVCGILVGMCTVAMFCQVKTPADTPHTAEEVQPPLPSRTQGDFMRITITEFCRRFSPIIPDRNSPQIGSNMADTVSSSRHIDVEYSVKHSGGLMVSGHYLHMGSGSCASRDPLYVNCPPSCASLSSSPRQKAASYVEPCEITPLKYALHMADLRAEKEAWQREQRHRINGKC